MDDLISRDFIKSLGGECIAARDSKTHELLPISSIDALPSAQPDARYINANELIKRLQQAGLDDAVSIAVKMAGHERLKHVPSAQQEPKSPLYYGDGYSEGKMVYDSAECPNCGYIYDEGDHVWGEPYCPHCGQALDWYMRGEQDGKTN